MLLRHILIALGVAVLPQSARAADWWLSGATDTALYLVDRSSIRQQDGHSVAWVTIVYFEPAANGTARHQRLGSYDCAHRRTALLATSMRDVNNNVVFSESYSGTNWQYVEPETVGESSLEFVCRVAMGAEPDGRFFDTIDDTAVIARTVRERFSTIQDPTEIARSILQR